MRSHHTNVEGLTSPPAKHDTAWCERGQHKSVRTCTSNSENEVLARPRHAWSQSKDDLFVKCVRHGVRMNSTLQRDSQNKCPH